MCELCVNANQAQLNKGYDPTRTLTLRNAFVVALNKRFKRLKRLVTYKIVTLDYFGLKTALNTYSSPQNVEGFLRWLEEQEKTVILDKRLLDSYVRLSYERGIVRARAELRKQGVNVSEFENQLQNIIGEQTLTRLPYHIDHLGALYSRVFTELSGITTEMNTQIMRILSDGLLQGDSPANLARKINSAIIETKQSLGLDISYVTKTGKTVSYFMTGRRRAEIMARTEVIRAHHIASIKEYERWGAYGVTVEAEFATANDDRVCPSCAFLQGTIWSLDEIITMIPVHPQCRCFGIPKVVKG